MTNLCFYKEVGTSQRGEPEKSFPVWWGGDECLLYHLLWGDITVPHLPSLLKYIRLSGIRMKGAGGSTLFTCSGNGNTDTLWCDGETNSHSWPHEAAQVSPQGEHRLLQARQKDRVLHFWQTILSSFSSLFVKAAFTQTQWILDISHFRSVATTATE